MNRIPVLVLALATFFPTFMQAQEPCLAHAEQALRDTCSVPKSATQTFTLEFRPSGESVWCQRLSDHLTFPISNPGVAALFEKSSATPISGQQVSPGQAMLLQPLEEALPGLMARKEQPAPLDASLKDNLRRNEPIDFADDGQSGFLNQTTWNRFGCVRGADEEPTLEQPNDDYFHAWQYDIQFLSGYIGVNLGPMGNVPFNMVPELVRIGCIWNEPRPERLLSGCWEGILELDTLPVVDGPATIVIGSSLLIRYHCVKRKKRRIVPYLQYGGGAMYTNAYLFGSPVLSSGFEFIIQAGFGVNVFLNNRWALTAEWNYYHFSNGGIVLPNVSVNMLGGVIGLTYYIGRK
jgi:hypothetical protein